MKRAEIERRLADRASRYPGAQPLPPGRAVHIYVDPDYAGTYAGQVAALTAASLFGRMSTSVAISASSVPASGVTEVDVEDHRAILHTGVSHVKEDYGGQGKRELVGVAAQAGGRG